jgi:hypothetical protein
VKPIKSYFKKYNNYDCDVLNISNNRYGKNIMKKCWIFINN